MQDTRTLPVADCYVKRRTLLQAQALAAPLGPEVVADIAEDMLSCGCCPHSVVSTAPAWLMVPARSRMLARRKCEPLWYAHFVLDLLQAATLFLRACKACNRSATALELYEALVQNASWSMPAADHAVGLWAYMAPANCSSRTLDAALRLLEEQGELLAAEDPNLAASTCRASLAAMRNRPQNSRPERYAALAAVARPGTGAAAGEEQLLALLDLPARLVLECLYLAAKSQGAEAAAALLPEVMQGLQQGSGSQALAFLELLPSWVEGLQPSQADWDTALACVLKDGCLGSRQQGQEPVAGAVAAVCSRLRAGDPYWALELSAPALVRNGQQRARGDAGKAASRLCLLNCSTRKPLTPCDSLAKHPCRLLCCWLPTCCVTLAWRWKLLMASRRTKCCLR